MRIKFFTWLFNDEIILPFLLSHYRWADALHAFVGYNSKDRTVAELDRHILAARGGCRHVPRTITYEDLTMPQGMDDCWKVAVLNERICRPTENWDWYVVVDSDELVWPPGDPKCRTVRDVLGAVPKDKTVLNFHMWDVFRHETDSDLDPEVWPVALQRRHGKPVRGYRKPAMFRPNHQIRFNVGCHDLCSGGGAVSDVTFDGAHWAHADASFSIARRLLGHQSNVDPKNVAGRLGWHKYDVTEASVRAEIEDGKQYPQCF